MKIGVRPEDKSLFERRVPLIPSDISQLKANGIDIAVQSSAQRAFSDDEYRACGIEVCRDLSDCDMIFGIKEISKDAFEPKKIYVFFSHVIKGQTQNMPMLRRMMEQKNTLIDYERITDDNNRRLIFFGRHAGLAGMINTLWAFGKRLEFENIANPFARLSQAMRYHDLNQAKAVIMEIAEDIRTNGIPDAIHPMIVGFAGYGNVFKGTQEIFDLLPVEEIQPESLAEFANNTVGSMNRVYKVLFRKQHTVRPKDMSQPFDSKDYERFGIRKYESNFEQYADHLTILVNCIYWDRRYPRLLSVEKCRQMWGDGKNPKLKVIGDISCDIRGAIECTVKASDSSNPLYVYDPSSDQSIDGIEGHGPVMMAIDILPSEIPRESSEHFSSVLKQFVPALVNADYSLPFETLNLPRELRKAVIIYHGELTEDYDYLREFIAL